MKGASAHNNSRSQSQVVSFVSRQRTDTGILKRRKFFDTFKVSSQMTPLSIQVGTFMKSKKIAFYTNKSPSQTSSNVLGGNQVISIFGHLTR